MNEAEADELAWRAFNLGARVAYNRLEKDYSTQEMSGVISQLRQIADKDLTLNDPTRNAIKYPQSADAFHSIGNALIQCDADLAERARRGLINGKDE